jgi:hypothetical protein
MEIEIMHTKNPAKLVKELQAAIDDRSVFQRLLDRATEQDAERAAAKE